MNTRICSLLLLVGVVSVSFSSVACRSDKHQMADAKPGTVMSCKECYDEVAKYQTNRRGYSPVRTVVTHHCAMCKSDMSMYDQDGVAMIRCAGCAPDGMPCDKCLPPR